MITNLENSKEFLDRALSEVRDLTVARFGVPQGRIADNLGSATREIELAGRVLAAVRDAAPRTGWGGGFAGEVRDIESALTALYREMEAYWRNDVRRTDAPSGEEAEAQLTEIQEGFTGRINAFKAAIDEQGARIQGIQSFVSEVRAALIS